MESQQGEITLLLDRIAGGDRGAEEVLLPHVYSELHRIANSRLRSERAGHTLQPTALVHEAYLRLCKSDNIIWQNRVHFFRVAAMLMRRILVDYARHRNKGGDPSARSFVPIDDVIVISPNHSARAIEIDDLLNKLAKISPRQAQVVEMRFFAGLSEEEIALAVDKSVRTVRRDWLMARAWLYEQLRGA